MIKENLTLI